MPGAVICATPCKKADLERLAAAWQPVAPTPEIPDATGANLRSRGGLRGLCWRSKLCHSYWPHRRSAATFICPSAGYFCHMVDEPPAICLIARFRDGIDDELELRVLQRDAGAWLAQYQAQEAEASGIPKIKVGYNKVLAITRSQSLHAAKVPEHYQRKQTLVNAERFITPELKEYEDKVLSADERPAPSKGISLTQRGRLLEHLGALQQAATDLAL